MDEMTMIEVDHSVWTMELSPLAKLILIHAKTTPDFATIANAETVSRYFKVPFGTARKALAELKREGLATFYTGNTGGRIYHRWIFRWPAKTA